MNPVYSRTMIDQVKAEIEALVIEQNEIKKQIKSIAEMVSLLEKSLRELTVAIAADLPLRKS